ncbi:unnamed protein product [Ranitomeya imitator]|uniref:OTU domain-containing protein 3 n=1 Tax=Ranitomeya imitator TaxID=111125 RepID=A0ABN9MED6_9NEOB|nr:unnamed protein product [Ranitomeya imitator]
MPEVSPQLLRPPVSELCPLLSCPGSRMSVPGRGTRRNWSGRGMNEQRGEFWLKLRAAEPERRVRRPGGIPELRQPAASPGAAPARGSGRRLEGHSRNHLRHRQETADYMVKHRHDFEPFVEDDVPFDRHVQNLAQPGTFAGNDAIVSFARNNQVNVVIHQLNNPLWQHERRDHFTVRRIYIMCKSIKTIKEPPAIHTTRVTPQTPMILCSNTCHELLKAARKKRSAACGDLKEAKTGPEESALSTQIRGSDKANARELHIAYRYGEHYDSVRPVNDNTETPAHLQTEMLSKDVSNRKGKTKLNLSEERAELRLDAVQKVRNATGCADVSLILQSLEAESYDIESTIQVVLQIKELKQIDDADCAAEGSDCSYSSATWEPGDCEGLDPQRRPQHPPAPQKEQAVHRTQGRQPRPRDDPQEQNKKNISQKVSNKQRKDQQRQEKKKRQEERHRQKAQEQRSNNADNNRQEEDASGVTVVKAISTLNI